MLFSTAGGEKTLITPAKSVGADGDGSKYLRARGMGSDGAADRSRVEQFAVFFAFSSHSQKMYSNPDGS